MSSAVTASRRPRFALPSARYRQLLGNLVRRELKVKYKNSVLGFLWSFLNPAMYLTIFGIALGYFLRADVPWFAFFLLCGLLTWNFASTAVSAGTASFVGNASLISKVYFPRSILPLSAGGAALVHFVLQTAILVAAMIVTGYARSWDAGLVLLPLALVVEIALVVALSLILSCVNVRFRDMEHLVEVTLIAWMWMTPIVYPIALVQDRLASRPWLWQAYLANPMAAVVLAMQRALYSNTSVRMADGTVRRVLVEAPLSWYVRRLGYAALVVGVLLVLARIVFVRLEPRLAEEV